MRVQIHNNIYMHKDIEIYLHRSTYVYMNIYIYIYIYIYIHTFCVYIYEDHQISFQTFFVWALLLIIHT